MSSSFWLKAVESSGFPPVHSYRFQSSFLVVGTTHTFRVLLPFSSHCFFLSILRVWMRSLPRLPARLFLPLRGWGNQNWQREMIWMMQAVLPTNPLDKHMLGGWCDGKRQSLGPSASEPRYSCQRPARPCGTEGTHSPLPWVHFSYNVAPNSSHLFPPGPI